MTIEKNILIKNIYYMLSYAFTSLKQDSLASVEKEDFHNIHNLFAAIFSQGIALQLKRGIYREYIEQIENLPTLRGKIDMAGTIHNRIAHRRTLSCEFDELSENNLLNQILKTTVLLLMRHPNVESKYKDQIKREMMFFSEVDLIDPTAIKWSAIRFRRDNHTYQMLISLCQLILEGMLMTTDSGENKLASFVDERQMNLLFEKFVLEYYIQEHPSVKASAKHIAWALDDDIRTMLPVMKSDIMLEYQDKVLIIDTKFYARTTQNYQNSHTIHSNNLYQIFTYVKNKAMEQTGRERQVSGLLLYAKTDERIQPDNEYLMSGNRISVKTLDLNQRFPAIREQLDKIVVSEFDLMTAGA